MNKSHLEQETQAKEITMYLINHGIIGHESYNKAYDAVLTLIKEGLL